MPSTVLRRAPANPAHAHDSDTRVEALLRELVTEQRAQRVAIDALVARLVPGPRDRGDEQLVGLIATSTRGHTFTCAALWRHQTADAALAAALADADLESPRMLGKLLRRVEARDVGAVQIVCVGEHRDGKVWQARVRE